MLEVHESVLIVGKYFSVENRIVDGDMKCALHSGRLIIFESGHIKYKKVRIMEYRGSKY